MSGGAAHIRSPEVLRRLRGHVVRFTSSAEAIVADMRTDISKMLDWLQGEQLSHWKSQLIKREEAYKKAKLDYLRIREDTKRLSKVSTVDARVLMNRAQQKKEEAERKIALLKKWSQALQREAERKMGPLNSLAILLDQTTPRTLNRLDTMIEHLEEYFRLSGGAEGAP